MSSFTQPSRGRHRLARAARLGAWCIAPWLAASIAGAEPRTIEAGQSLTFNFDLLAANRYPPAPFTGVTLTAGVTAANGARGTWQVFTGPDGRGTLVFSGPADLVQQDLFVNELRYGVFSVRLTLTQGSLSVDPTASAFRHMSREIGVLFGDAVWPRSVSAEPAAKP